MMRKFAISTLVGFMAAVCGAAEPWATERDAAELGAELTALFQGAEVRHPGTPGNLALEAKAAKLFAGSSFKHGEMRFSEPRFVPGKTELRLGGGPPIRVFAMHPTFFRPGNFTERDFAAPMVYLGRGGIDDLTAVKGVSLDGAIALLEMDSGDNWRRLLRFGVRGFVFIGAQSCDPRECRLKVYSTEVRVPRFFAPESDGAVLRSACKTAGGPVSISVSAEPSRWERAELRNLWVLIPGSDSELEKDVVVITAPMDANCVVPEMAYGAQSGANLCLLMRLFSDFSRRPPARTVLLAAVNGRTRNFLGERMLAWNLVASSSAVERARDTISADLRAQKLLYDFYKKLSLRPPTTGDADLVREMRTLTDSTTGRNLTMKEPLVTLARRDINQLKTEQLSLVRQGVAGGELKQRLDKMNARRDHLVNVLTLFNKVGHQTNLPELTDEELDILRGYVDEIVRDNGRWADLNRGELEASMANAGVRDAIEGRTVRFVLSLDLTWTGGRVGFSADNYHGWERWQHKWGMAAARVAGGLQGIRSGEREDLFVDGMTKQGGLPEMHYYPVRWPGVDCFLVTGTPAFSLRTGFGDEGQAFCPSDSFENMDRVRMAGVMKYVQSLVPAMLADREISQPSVLEKPSRRQSSWAVRTCSYRFDEFSASVLPDLPVPGTFIVLTPSSDAVLDPRSVPIVSGDVINSFAALTDERATAMFYGIVDQKLASAAFHMDADFVAVDQVLDGGQSESQRSSTINSSVGKCILPMFACDEFPIYERTDPSAISVSAIDDTEYSILEGRMDGAPRKEGISGARSKLSAKLAYPTVGPAAVFLDPGERLKLLTGRSRVVLHASEKKPEGDGFASAAELGPDLYLRVCEDTGALAGDRLANLSGVSDELVRTFLDTGRQRLKNAREALAANDHVAYLRELAIALGAQVKAYTQTAAISNDMLKAVVFYMALMLPFCFFLEKLWFRFVKIEAEMGMFGVMFVLTFILFRVIHPAFRIAEAPEAIFIAFVMGGLGLFVISILHSRFEGEMQILFRTYTGMDTAEVGYSTVGQKAMLIGVNNMKRRRIRTALTTATIVLVTFTMLAFTSVSRTLSPTVIHKKDQAPYTGLMYHWPGNERMDESTVRVLEELFAGEGRLAIRRWLLPKRKGDQSSPFRVEAGGRTARLDAILGLPAAEDGFVGRIPMACGRFFTSDRADEAILTAGLASAMGITQENMAENRVTFMNHELKIAGILDDARFRELTDLNQRPLLPIKSLAKRGWAEEAAADREALADSSDDALGVFYVDPSALMVLPSGAAERFGARPFSVSLRLDDGASVWPLIDRLLTVTRAARFHVGSLKPFSFGSEGKREVNPGVYYIGDGYRTSIGGLSSLIIPLLIAATIILNTMLGSVYERKSEISVYNAVGLNPTHIGMFFLAESFVYSVIGSVGGYLIGQVLSIGLTRFGIIEEINLNFSSLSVVYVILFTIAVVMLSTLYPAVVATKAAIPSGKRKWAFPPNDGNEMTVLFPFIYQPHLILGIMGYLQEYFARFTEASVGELIARLDKAETGTDPAGRPTYALQYHVAVAPFDLGVTEKVVFKAEYEEKRIQAYRIKLHILRLSGQDTNWVTTNKPFMERLRTYFLHWRNLDDAEHALYVQRGELGFGTRTEATARSEERVRTWHAGARTENSNSTGL